VHVVRRNHGQENRRYCRHGSAILLCGCPGLFSLLLGGMFALISFVPGANIDIMGSSDPRSALNFGIGGLCVGIVFVLIAAAAIFFAWRRNLI